MRFDLRRVAGRLARLAAYVTALCVLAFGASMASAAGLVCTVTAPVNGTRNDTNIQNASTTPTLAKLRVIASAGQNDVFDLNGDTDPDSPAYVCSNLTQGPKIRFTGANGVKGLGGRYTFTYANGASITLDGSIYVKFTPAPGQTGSFSLDGTGTLTTIDAQGTQYPAGGSYSGSIDIVSATAPNAASSTDYFRISVFIVGPPTINTVSPAAGSTGGGNGVSISGSGFSASGNSVTIGGTAVTPTAQSTTSITFTAPPHAAGAVNVVVTTSDAQTATATNAYTYVAPPTVTALAPVAGPSGGATSVVVTGTNFSGTTAVSFGATPATNFTVNSNTQITATAPAGAAGSTVNITVTTAGGTSAAAPANQYKYTVPLTNAVAAAPSPITTGGTSQLTFTLTNPAGNPAVAGVASTIALPTNVVIGAAPGITDTCGGTVTAAAGGGSIALTGGSLAAGASCTFGAAVTSNTAGTYTIPTGAATSTTTTGAAGNAGSLTVNNPPTPTVSSISPTGGSTGGGTPVTITGSNFVSGNTYSATFGGATVAATYASATTLTATAPPGTGTVAVTVTNTTTSQAGTGSANYAYAAPTVTALSMTSGPAGTTRPVTITGTNFTPTATVAVGGTAATGVAYVSATQLSATLPAKAAGAYDVQVTTGTVTSAANPPADQYTYVAAPTVTSVTPNTGSTAGGTNVTVNGSNLTNASAVTFGGNPATNVVVAGNGLSLTATTPNGTAGAQNVVVTTPGGTGTLAGGYTYVVLSPPAVTTQPQSQTVAVGATATFTAAASGTPSPTVQWQVSSDSGGAYTDVAGATATSYTTPATTAADNGKLFRATFTNSQGTATTAAATLTVVQAPTANSQSVATAYQTAKAITLSGTDPNTLPRTLTYTVATSPAHGTLSGTAPNLTYTPAAGYNGPDSFTFTVNNGVSTSAPATVSITVQGPAPSVGTVTPNQGSTTGGISITISGANFTGATQVTVGGAPAANVVVVNDAMITAVTPPGTAGPQLVAVTNATGISTTNGMFTYLTPPTANAQSVTTAYQTPKSVTLTGTNATSYTVTIAPTHGTLSGTAPNLTYTPTAGYSGADSFAFTTTNGSGAGSVTSAPATVSITIQGQAPTVTLVTPNQGSTAGGTAIAINGSGFTGATGATIGGNPVTNLVVVSDTRINATTPGSAAGAASVIVTNPAGSNAANVLYTYVAPATANAQTVTTAYNTAAPITLTASGSAPITYTVATAPVHGTLSGTAPNLTYTPTAGYRGADSFTFTASNGGGTSAPATVSITVGDPTITVSGTPPSGQRGQAYTATLTASGGTAPYTFAVASGALPPGLTVASSGSTATISGTPTASGNFQAAFQVTDSSNPAATATTATYAFAIAAPTVVINPASGALPAASVGAAYSQTVSSTGTGTAAPYTYAITAGALPAGLTLSNGGTLSGTSTMGGNYSFSITATDSSTAASGGPYSATAAYTLAVQAATITISPATLPGATVGTAYTQTVSASGGTAPYSYAVTAGALPAGLTLASNGTLSGTPTAGGSYSFTITATDSSTGNGAPFRGSRTYTLTVGAPTVTIAPATLPNATANAAYNQTLSTGGGTAPYSYAITAGALPTGLTLADSGTLSGTPTSAGSFTFSVTATDSSTGAGPYTATRSYTVTVNAVVITVSPATLPGGTVAAAYSQTIAASGGAAPYTFAITAGALPNGITLSSTGTLSGTPTAGGSFTFTVTARDASNNVGSRSYMLTIAAPTIVVAPATLPAGTTRIAYSQTLTASGGTAPYSYAITAGALPAGLTLASNGTLAGIPTTAGSFTFSVTVRDSSTGSGPYAGTRSYTLTIAQPTIEIAPATLPGATTRVAYNQMLTASGGNAPYSFAITAGALPGGITLSATGTLSGTPTTAGSYSFTVTASDANGNTGSSGYTLVVAAPAIAIAPTTLPGGQVAAAYSQAITASGGAAPYGYAITTGTLPTGLTLSSTGTLSGTPTAGGSFTFTVTATDANGNAGSRSYTLTIAAPAPTLAPASLPGGTAGQAYSQQITASGATAPYTYAVTAGTLPTGLTLSNTGLLSGTTTTGGSFTFSVTATDSSTGSGPYAATRSYTVTIAAPANTITPATLNGVTVGAAYSQTVTTTGGTGPYSYAITAGALPTGLTLSSNGTLAGTPTAGGNFTFSVTSTDSTPAANGGPFTATRSYALAVAAPTLTLAPASLPGGNAGQAYNQQITASGGTAPYTYAITAGALPSGLTLSSGGTLSGTTAQSGSFTFSVAATDSSTGSGPYTATRSYTLTIAAPTLTITPATISNATVGTSYSQALSTTGGAAPYSYAITAGALPAGVTLAANGTIAGTPTAGGSFAFTVTSTDSTTAGNGGPYTASRSFTLTVAAPTIAIAPVSLPNGQSGAAYSQQLTATGGTAPYAYAVTAGALPNGLTLSAAGAVSGTPTQSGSFTFSVTATDSSTGSGPYNATRSYTLTIAAPTLTIAPATLGGAAVGTAYTQTLSTTGGTAPYSYAITAGALPAGLTLSNGGTLSGTPTSGGSFTFTVTSTDSTAAANGGSYTASRSYTLTVAAATVTVAPATLPTGQSSVAYSQTLTASGGTAPYSFAVTAGTLPAGLTLSSTGVLSGTPTQSGSFTFTATATDSSTGAGPYSGARSYTLTIAAPTLTLTPATVPSATVSIAYSQVFATSGGTAPYAYTVTAGTLPAGLTLSTGGTLSGTPTQAGTYTYSITSTDGTAAGNGGPYSTTRSYTQAVNLPPAPTAQDAPAQSVQGSTTTSGSRSITIDLSSQVSGNYNDIQISSQPQHGSVTVAQSGGRFIATYTPTVGYAGNDSFGFVAVGIGGRSSEARAAITVTGAVPTAASLRANTISGQPVLVDLTAAASGGPFVSARIVAISPSDAATAILVEGGSATDRTYQLRVTPGGRFSGTVTVQYTLSNAFGASAVAAVTITVGARPDPTQDSAVSGIVAAQAESTQRFAQAQTDNFLRRTEQLHNGGNGSQGVRFGITASGGNGQFRDLAAELSPERSDVVQLKMDHATAVSGAEGGAGLYRGTNGSPFGGLTGARGNRDAALYAGGAKADDANAAPGAPNTSTGERSIGSVAIWSGGSISVGTRDAATRRDRLSFSSGGLSAGADLKLSDDLIVGAGGGYGGDRTKIGRDDEARVDGKSWVGALYGSFSPDSGIFLDGVIGAGHIKFDSRRAVSANASVATSSRDGSMVFGSLAGGFDRTSQTFTLSAYGRVSFLSADLDPYSENGAGLYNLAFARRSLNSISGTLGGRAGLALGQWTPTARVEWRHEFRDAGDQLLDYADLGGYTYRLQGSGWLRDSVSGQLGLGYATMTGWRFEVDLGGDIGSGARAATGRATISKRF